MKSTIFFLLITALGAAYFFPHKVLADKPSVSIEAPESAAKGSEITLKIHVEHDGNSIFHYTKWLYVMANNNEIARYDYTWRKRPESENFTKEIVCRLNEPIEIVAEASCNTHGSKGKVTTKISVHE